MVENYEVKFFKSLKENDFKYFGRFFQSIYVLNTNESYIRGTSQVIFKNLP